MKINTVDVLYHGTNCKFDTIDFAHAKEFKDFGKGFYLTSNLRQAQRWAQKKSEREGIAYIYCYHIKQMEEDGLKVLELLQYNKDWVDFISKSRIEGYETDYDIIYDRMADNQYLGIADTLQKYVSNQISPEEVVNRIKWNNFNADQYCFKSEKALTFLYDKQIIVQHRDDCGRWIQE